MTANEIKAKVRRIVNDTAEPYRWSDEELREHLQAALRRLCEKAPHTRYLPDGIVDYIVLPEGEGDETFHVDSRYAEPLALYVAYLCYFNDATDTVNAERASACLTRAESLMY